MRFQSLRATAIRVGRVELAIRRTLGLSLLAALLLAGCEDSGGDIDPTPEDQTGRPSTEFETEDIEQAEGAGRLVELYCEDVPSEAQRVGCLSHVSESDVCDRSTAAKREAIAAYIDETGADPC